MRMIWTVALAFIVAMIGLGPIGCGGPKKTATGGGGTGTGTKTEKTTTEKTTTEENGTKTKTKTTTEVKDDKDNIFTLSVPKTATDIDQGAKKDLTVSITRGSKFKEKVTITLKPGKDLTVDPKEKVLTSDETNFKFTLTAAKTAAPGDNEIEVSATPETGKPAMQKIAIHVKEKK